MQLKGTKSGTNGTVKTKRVVDFKVRVLQLKADGKTAKEALIQGCQEFNVPLTPGMERHPHSFVNMYKNSLNSALKKGDKVVEGKVLAASLADNTPAPKAEEVEEVPEVEETEEPIEDEAEEFEPESDDSQS